MMLNAGDLDRVVSIEKPVVVRNSADGSESISWITLATVSASIRESATGNNSFLGAGVVVAQAKPTTIRIRWRNDVDARCRIRYGTRLFAVMGVAELGRRVGLELACKEWSHD